MWRNVVAASGKSDGDTGSGGAAAIPGRVPRWLSQRNPRSCDGHRKAAACAGVEDVVADVARKGKYRAATSTQQRAAVEDVGREGEKERAVGQWESSLLRQRIAEGALFQNVSLTHASAILSSEAARMDGQLLDDFASLLRGNTVYIHNFLCEGKDMRLYDALKAELVASTGATMVGKGGLIEWSKHQVFDNPTDISNTFTEMTEMLAEYFDVDVYATRLNYYRDGTQWKPQHHDSHAYGGRALREDFTAGLTLGATRSLLFVHEASQREFSFPQLNGDCFAFTGEVNQLFTHGVPRVHTPIGDRFSIIVWGRRRSLNQRNGGAPSNAAWQLQGRQLDTMEDAVTVAKQLVAAQPTRVNAQKPLAASSAGEADEAGDPPRVPQPVKRKKNRLQ